MQGIEVEVERSGDLLRLDYRVSGRIGGLRLPPAGPPERRDGLWRHSCFEAFLGHEQDYLELNLSPSAAWAAYRFGGYRSDMREAGIATPAIATARTLDLFGLKAEARIPGWEGRLGLSAVIEEENGGLSYWALAHPPGAPDFHHPSCFALELPPPA